MFRMLKDSAEEGFSKATAYGLQTDWKTAQHVIAKAFKHHFFSGFSDGRGKGTGSSALTDEASFLMMENGSGENSA